MEASDGNSFWLMLTLFIVMDIVLIGVVLYIRRLNKKPKPPEGQGYQPDGVYTPPVSPSSYQPQGTYEPPSNFSGVGSATASEAPSSFATSANPEWIEVRHTMLVSAVKQALQSNHPQAQRFYRQADGKLYFDPTVISDPSQRERAARAFRTLLNDDDDQLDFQEIFRLIRDTYTLK